MGGRYDVPLKNLTQLPAAHDIGNTTIFLNAADDDLGNEFAIAVHQQLAVC